MRNLRDCTFGFAMTLCVAACLSFLAGCQSSRAIGKTQSPHSLYFANDAHSTLGDSSDSFDPSEASVLEESPAKAASDSSWSRIFNRFRPVQHVSELPRTDIDEDPVIDESTGFDSGF
jgi:hypothetical protein